MGRIPEARTDLEKNVVTPSTLAPRQRRLANAWSAVGDNSKANALFANLLKTSQTDPLIYRDAARLMARDRPQQALDNYARSMADRKSTRLNSRHSCAARMPSSA